jgi:hypothetical protein
MKKLFCVLLTATFILTTALYAQDKDKDAPKDKAAPADKDKDKAAPADDKDKAAPADKDKDKATAKDKEAPKAAVVSTDVDTWILIGDYAVKRTHLIVMGALIVVIIGVWYTLLRKKPTDESAPPPA